MTREYELALARLDAATRRLWVAVEFNERIRARAAYWAAVCAVDSMRPGGTLDNAIRPNDVLSNHTV